MQPPLITSCWGKRSTNVDTLDTLMSQRPGEHLESTRRRLDVERCRVVAPFVDAYYDMNESLGANSRSRRRNVTLIDIHIWYGSPTIASTHQSHIGSTVRLFLRWTSGPQFHGVVEISATESSPSTEQFQAGLPN